MYNVQITPESLFALAVLLHDGYCEFFESPFDRHLFAAQEMAVIHLARLGTESAYGYFKQYSDDPKVISAKSDKEFI